eukprot:gnl/Chilomastix_caulleri/1039.p1 GENE.gnl/Chilomastix_caulleri/1039~~gnl/Chilomastix_caulleri/1039.p1  ORF type:complete len:150 (+),score=26.83 gnl/Chilomastix_caulleri/1039:44-493(+)
MDLSDYASCVPGPGAYDPKPTNTSPKYSLSGRTQRKTYSNSPGPGAYNPKDSRELGASSPKSSLSGRIPQPRGTSVPGPGSYEPYPKNLELNHQNTVFQEERKYQENQGSPGPGAYKCSNYFRRPIFHHEWKDTDEDEVFKINKLLIRL